MTTSIAQRLSPHPCSAISRSSINPTCDTPSTSEKYPKYPKKLEFRSPTALQIYPQARRSLLVAPRHLPSLREMADINSVPHNFRKSAEDPRIFSAAE